MATFLLKKCANSCPKNRGFGRFDSGRNQPSGNRSGRLHRHIHLAEESFDLLCSVRRVELFKRISLKRKTLNSHANIELRPMPLRTLPPQLDAGTYQLRLKVQRTITVRIGALGNRSFPRGIYVYTGRAKRALQARIKRHRIPQKKPFWHIDYLLNHPMVNLTEIRIISNDPANECAQNRRLEKLPDSRPIPRFGSSDCTSTCQGHLVRVGSVSTYLATVRNSKTLAD